MIPDHDHERFKEHDLKEVLIKGVDPLELDQNFNTIRNRSDVFHADFSEPNNSTLMLSHSITADSPDVPFNFSRILNLVGMRVCKDESFTKEGF